MAEEQRCQEGHRLCANNCGFFGSPATNHLCSKCYRDLRLKEDQASSAMIAVKNSLSAPADVTIARPSSSSSSSSSAVEKEEEEERKERVAVPAEAEAPVRANRCGECRKKVGLTGFKCRCGITFCGTHRYAESQACGYDFKAAGKESIARANPVVKADKLRKI